MIRKKIGLTGLVLSVVALAAFLIACSNPAGPAGNRQTGGNRDQNITLTPPGNDGGPVWIMAQGDTVIEQLIWLRDYPGIRNNGRYYVVARAIDLLPENHIYGNNNFGITRYNITVLIQSDGAARRTLQLCGNVQGIMLEIGANNTLLLQNINFEGRSANTAPLVDVLANGALQMTNSEIFGNGARGVRVTSGQFTMRDNAVIRNNNGGAALYNGATLTMQGNSVIRHNIITVATNGGGVRGVQSIIHMYDDARIYRNEANLGGGVIFFGGDIFMWDRAAISHNEATPSLSGGTGVSAGIHFFPNSRLFMHNNATISHNTASGSTGGIQAQQSHIFMYDNAAISYNTAPGGGGVVMVLASSLNMHGDNVHISGNRALRDNPPGRGGGVLLNDNDTLNISGGRIQGNITSDGFTANTTLIDTGTAALYFQLAPNAVAQAGTYIPSGTPGVPGTFTPNASIQTIPSTNNTIRVWNNGNDREGW